MIGRLSVCAHLVTSSPKIVGDHGLSYNISNCLVGYIVNNPELKLILYEWERKYRLNFSVQLFLK